MDAPHRPGGEALLPTPHPRVLTSRGLRRRAEKPQPEGSPWPGLDPEPRPGLPLPSLPSELPHPREIPTAKVGIMCKAVTHTPWKFMPKLRLDFVRHPMTRKALQENHPCSCRAVRPQCSSRPARTAWHRPTLPPGAPGQPSCVHRHLRTQGSRSADGHFRDTPRP